MDSWKRFHDTSLPDKEAFSSELNLEDIKTMTMSTLRKCLKY